MVVPNAMTFEKFFRFVSYAAVLCGFFSLWVSGTFGVISTGLFLIVLVAGWLLEGTRWQVSERLGTALIVLALPAYYFAWRYQLLGLYGSETVVAGILARMILSLTAIKLLQKKSDRDWIFLYLMSFFEVLLAAGLSISALYMGSFLIYLLLMVCSIIAFEIRKTSRSVERKIAGEAPAKPNEELETRTVFPLSRLPSTAIALIVFTIALAAPLFFMLPRVGGAGFGGNQRLSTSSGFSDTVRLGGIGRIQQNDEVVMRVKMEASESTSGLYFRGVALDTFDNNSWSKSKKGPLITFEKGDKDLVQVDFASGRDNLSVQTIYLEPLDTPVLFALPRAVAFQGGFSFLSRDPYGSVTTSQTFERVSYKVLSDRSLPQPGQLRADDLAYTADVQNYRSLPMSFDPRITELANQIGANAKNRYDKAAAVENYLQNNFGYTLEQKAGGDEPLADFLFNVREGHCEYFATAMAVMLRTQGIATRIVNGFHGGEFNDAADVTVVRQRNAHAWVEVYFPKTDAWVPFDPTPFAQQTTSTASGISGAINKYLEAFETFWIQYFVAYDNQEQRTMMRSVRNGFVDYQNKIALYVALMGNVAGEWWADVRGDKGLQTRITAIGYGVGIVAGAVLGVLFIAWLYRRVRRLSLWRTVWDRLTRRSHHSIVDFYDRMQRILALQGLVREPYQTPLEFAYSTGIPETVRLTEKYNQVRFGEKQLSSEELERVESMLRRLETDKA
jgi:hypothetical protein